MEPLVHHSHSWTSWSLFVRAAAAPFPWDLQSHVHRGLIQLAAAAGCLVPFAQAAAASPSIRYQGLEFLRMACSSQITWFDPWIFFLWAETTRLISQIKTMRMALINQRMNLNFFPLKLHPNISLRSALLYRLPMAIRSNLVRRERLVIHVSSWSVIQTQ